MVAAEAAAAKAAAAAPAAREAAAAPLEPTRRMYSNCHRRPWMDPANPHIADTTQVLKEATLEATHPVAPVLSLALSQTHTMAVVQRLLTQLEAVPAASR